VSIESWSENVVIAQLQDDPALTDDLTALMDQSNSRTDVDMVLSFAGVNYLNSSNIAKLLKLRKKAVTNKRRLLLCAISTNVWGLFLVTGLDKIFEFADNVATALASLQLPTE
jgi:anti-anti-sigma factor